MLPVYMHMGRGVGGVAVHARHQQSTDEAYTHAFHVPPPERPLYTSRINYTIRNRDRNDVRACVGGDVMQLMCVCVSV